MTDIKGLLGRAIGDEPPMGIDRDEVFRAGRQRVRRRKALAAGGVVAAVVVAAVGAATLTNFVSPEPVPPAVGDSQHAPPGPDLPLPTTRTQQPPSSSAGVVLTEKHADELTQLLYQSNIVTRKVAREWPGRPGRPGFRVEEGAYLYEADIVGAGSEGFVQVSVEAAPPGSAPSCEDIDEQTSCEVTVAHSGHVAQATWKNQDGERRNVAVAVLADGTRVAAMASNFSHRHEDEGKRPTGAAPVLDMETLSRMILKSGFRVR